MNETINISQKNLNLENMISNQISKLNEYQQFKLLEFINSSNLNC